MLCVNQVEFATNEDLTAEGDDVSLASSIYTEPGHELDDLRPKAWWDLGGYGTSI